MKPTQGEPDTEDRGTRTTGRPRGVVSGITVRKNTARGTLLTLTLGHSAADLSSGALWALLPFLVAERHYSYAAAGVFALTASVASALFQPLVGAHGDRREAWLLLPAGLVVAGLGIAAVAAQPRPNKLLSLLALVVGVGLAVRGATGHCAVKAASEHF